MKKYKDQMTTKEVEELCNLYMDCGLSSLEEAELEYVLLTADYDSELIRETKAVMGISRKLAAGLPEESAPKQIRRRSIFRRYQSVVTGIAASIAIIFATMIGFFSPGATDIEYIAYANGHQLRGSEAREAAEAQITKYEQLERRMAQLQEQQLKKIERIKTGML